MTILLFVVGYFVVCLLLTPMREAATMAALSGLSLFGVVRLSRSRGPLEAFRWFRRHLANGLFVVALTCVAVVVGALNGMVLQMLIQAPLIFLWFWMFATIQTYFGERGTSMTKEWLWRAILFSEPWAMRWLRLGGRRGQVLVVRSFLR